MPEAPNDPTDTATWTAYREGKRPWYEIEPRDAVNPTISLPHPEIWGPVNEEGVECPWPWKPQQLVGVAMGQHHCEFCMAMVMAGLHHLDYVGLNEAMAADMASQPAEPGTPEVNGW